MFCFSFHQTLTRTVRSSKQIFVHRIPTKGGNCQFLGFFVGESPQREHGSFVISVFVGRILIVFEILSNVIIRVLVHHSFYYFCGLWNAGYIISLHKRKTWVFTLISKLTQISFTGTIIFVVESLIKCKDFISELSINHKTHPLRVSKSWFYFSGSHFLPK